MVFVDRSSLEDSQAEYQQTLMEESRKGENLEFQCQIMRTFHSLTRLFYCVRLRSI